LIATETRSGAGRLVGKAYYETPMSGTAASASRNCINSKLGPVCPRREVLVEGKEFLRRTIQIGDPADFFVYVRRFLRFRRR
jgi:hypothetical protein